MAEDKNRWWAFLNVVMNIGVPLNWEFLHQLRKYYLLKKDSASWSLSRQCALYLQVVGLADAAVNKMRYHVSFYGTGET
jgi:hypothetical protein